VKVGLIAKSVTEKKQQQGGLCGGRQKDYANPEARWVRIFACRGFCPGGADRNYLSGGNLTAFCRTLFSLIFFLLHQLNRFLHLNFRKHPLIAELRLRRASKPLP